MFSKFPKGTIRGDAFTADTGFATKRIPHRFQVTNVKGHVRWNYHGVGDARAALILKRWKGGETYGAVHLAKYELGPSPDDVTRAEFNLKPDAQNAFWEAGAAGTVLIYCKYSDYSYFLFS